MRGECFFRDCVCVSENVGVRAPSLTQINQQWSRSARGQLIAKLEFFDRQNLTIIKGCGILIIYYD